MIDKDDNLQKYFYENYISHLKYKLLINLIN